MKLNDFVFVLSSFKCDKRCPYCIAKMNNVKIEGIEQEIKNLKETIDDYILKKAHFKYFILSANGEPSLYSVEVLKEIVDVAESSKLFEDFRIQTSGNLFNDTDKLNLFNNWIKEITVVSSSSSEDKRFYNYQNEYLKSKEFINSSRIRVNLVALKSNYKKINKYINYYIPKTNVETIAIKILDNSLNDTTESEWITNNALRYDEIGNIIKLISHDNEFINFEDNRFIFKTGNDKLITINYNTRNNYDYINIKKENNDKKDEFSWHKSKIKKGTYGEFSKIEEEIMEAKDALDQNNHLMFLIELSDTIGAIEGLVNKYGLDFNDIKNFSDKVKESKKRENYKYLVKNGLVYLDYDLSLLERNLFIEFENMLLEKGYKYLSLPSAGSWSTVEKQGVVTTDYSLGIDETHALFGSAEQGILEYFENKEVNEELLLFADNQCFRNEAHLNGLKTLKEFKKIEQFCFCREENAEKYFNELLNNSISFLEKHNIKYRIVDKTKEDKGYHYKKYDIEVKTKMYGWMETHSCTYFKDEQVKRFNITGGMHTISNTGIASPRILIPFIEKNDF